jgi:hypothetical protein
MTSTEAEDLEWAALMSLTSREQRRVALFKALESFELSLSAQKCWVPDVMARIATLQEAIAEYGDAVEARLAGVPNNLH